MTFIRVEESFTCERCSVKTQGNGFTNHCPNCLWSLHVDIEPGDRMNECRGMMKPLLIESGKKGARVVHECLKCGHRKANRLSPNDDYDTMLRIMSEHALKHLKG